MSNFLDNLSKEYTPKQQAKPTVKVGRPVIADNHFPSRIRYFWRPYYLVEVTDGKATYESTYGDIILTVDDFRVLKESLSLIDKLYPNHAFGYIK